MVTKKQPPDLTKRLIQAESYLRARNDIAFAYLFGSLAENRATHLSDVDIAVYLTEGKFEDKRFQILGDLIDIFKTDGLDLVILNTAPLILKMKIIQARRILADNFPYIRHTFESATIRTYLDFSKMENRILEERYMHG
jgi:predicted nucleotidyltransferase